MKVISMYLPQFHRVKENDEWWGEGFTEWVAARRTKPLFEGHYQPHIPLNNNYYDLLCKDTMQWQADLMKQYGIDGQCIYHYWFGEGRRILEKPAENLLHWTDIDMPFCFCWANESWARTWTHLKNYTPWSSELEPGRKESNDNGILIEQKYGTEKQWRQHFDYLLPFFKDKRYIKIENKPIFMIYKTSEIDCLKEMMTLWRKWAVEAGFSGVYLIGANNYGADVLDIALSFEPEYAMGRLKGYNKSNTGIARYKYEDIWNEILKYPTKGKKITVQGVVGRDSTPRMGREGQVIEDANPDFFREYMAELIAKNISNGCDITFVNAWNEWGEGMHLEPDEKYKHGFLEGISYAKSNYKKYLKKYSGELPSIENAEKEIEYLTITNRRYRSYWRVMDSWLTLKENGIGLDKLFIARGMYSVAIYGIGLLGKHLYYELKNSMVEVRFAVDRAKSFNDGELKLYRPEDELPDVDIIVITPTYAYNEISEQLAEKGYTNVISLEKVINDWTQ